MRGAIRASAQRWAAAWWQRLTAETGALAFIRETLLILGLYGLYILGRKLIADYGPGVSSDNALRVIRIEDTWGFYWERSWQDWAMQGAELIPKVLNWVYILGFLPVAGGMAALVYLVDHKRYYRYRTVFFVSYGLALIGFTVFPLAPPRLTQGFGFVDTIAALGPRWYDQATNLSHYNAFAAMPSLHFGWACLFGVLFFRWGPRWLKVVGVAYPAAMFAAITVTGNHYILDAVAGVAVMLASYLVTQLIIRRRALALARGLLGPLLSRVASL